MRHRAVIVSVINRTKVKVCFQCAKTAFNLPNSVINIPQHTLVLHLQVGSDKINAELLFNHLSLRTGRKATIITTNLSFDRWQEIFGDPVLTAALVDRITHKAHLVNMNGSHTELKKQKK